LTLPATERHNELNWVDANAPSPLQVPGLPPLKGGDVFASSRERTNYNTDYKNVQPRIGLAYSLNDKTVVRTGYGIYFDPSHASANADAVQTQGFAQTTPWVSTNPGDHATPYGGSATHSRTGWNSPRGACWDS